MTLLFIDVFVNFFTNIFNILMVALFILIGVFLGLLFKPKAKDQVMKLIPRDRRFIDFNVAMEDAFGVECEPKKGYPPQRFIKYRPGFTGQVGKFLKRSVTRYFGLEGTAYTCQVQSTPVMLGTLAEALKGIWGEKFYNTVPEPQRLKLEKEKVDVIVDLEEIKTPHGFKEVSEENIKQEEDRKAAQTWWEGKKMAEKTTLMQWLFIFLAGAGAMAIASKLLGWW